MNEVTKVETRKKAALTRASRDEANRLEGIAGELFNDAGMLLRDGYRDQAAHVLEIASRFAGKAAVIDKGGFTIYAG